MEPADFLEFYKGDFYIQIDFATETRVTNKRYLLFWSPVKKELFVAVHNTTSDKIITVMPFERTKWQVTDVLLEQAKALGQQYGKAQESREALQGFAFRARIIRDSESQLVDLFTATRKDMGSLKAATSNAKKRTIRDKLKESLREGDSLLWVVVEDLHTRETLRIARHEVGV